MIKCHDCGFINEDEEFKCPDCDNHECPKCGSTNIMATMREDIDPDDEYYTVPKGSEPFTYKSR